MIKYIQKKLYEHKVYRETIDELCRLTDKEMQDIGINGADIHYIASEASRSAVSLKYGD